MMGRIMAIDYGDARTGIAVSDLTGMITGSAFTIEEWNEDRLLQKIINEAKQRDITTFVLGLPKNMDGSEGPRAEKCRDFGDKLQQLSGITVIMWDERRSSIEAHAILHSVGKKEKKHRESVDAVAASLMLEGYLGSLS